MIQNLWNTARGSLPQEDRKISNNLTLDLKQLAKEEQIKPKVDRKNGIIKIRAEINKTEMKKIIARSKKLKAVLLRR